MTADLLKRIEELKPWYHKIDLGNGIITPGKDWEKIWAPITKLMDNVDYKGKQVLDLASWDGMWAFEAEKRGASLVVATDTRIKGYRNLLLAREALKSDVIPLCNVSVQNLQERLSVVGMPEKYDIIHHFGLFYHLRDPLLSLAQCRKMLTEDGTLLLETAFINDNVNSYMQFSGLPGRYHFYGATDTWAPTKRCLKEILIRSFLQPVEEKKWQYVKPPLLTKQKRVGRISLMAKPLPESKGTTSDRHKVFGCQ
jgi:2-polyprenyl-3-methyl-5-hydroxy-6-metoxy-1,4-benzoquinol methylase